ncbi:hypothetical protein NPIL_677471 [Nephila pilipes]|uniref:Uncharacterized protein n=1 Tax=Nephila pilipes TaxID=299642 RepID=A0A8X6PFW2_NEPPI|nr:hypothetical protein NPIL_677471 [Nephila pilipes]
MGSKNKVFNVKNPNDLETRRNKLFCANDDSEAIVLDESNTDKEEHISVLLNSESDARDTDGAKIDALLGLLYLAGVYYGNSVNLEELGRTD